MELLPSFLSRASVRSPREPSVSRNARSSGWESLSFVLKMLWTAVSGIGAFLGTVK